MAHFEGGALAEAFRQDPKLDPHELVRQEIIRIVGRDYPRKYVKETGFGILYGMGAPTLGTRLGERSTVARELMDAYKIAIPGVESLQRGTKRRGRNDQPIRTWGGRLIYKEPPRIIEGRMRSFEYKLLNYLIQGSAADQTKACTIEWDNQRYPDQYLMAQVHDELNISVPRQDVAIGMEILQHAMDETGTFDVPMRSDGFTGPSWGQVGDI
jgi:DNA polymerase-1